VHYHGSPSSGFGAVALAIRIFPTIEGSPMEIDALAPLFLLASLPTDLHYQPLARRKRSHGRRVAPARDFRFFPLLAFGFRWTASM
jgi:hypothetical protein